MSLLAISPNLEGTIILFSSKANTFYLLNSRELDIWETLTVFTVAYLSLLFS